MKEKEKKKGEGEGLWYLQLGTEWIGLRIKDCGITGWRFRSKAMETGSGGFFLGREGDENEVWRLDLMRRDGDGVGFFFG